MPYSIKSSKSALAMLAAGMLGTFSLPDQVQAAEIELLASFRPSALDPTRNAFQNDTPNTGICQTNPNTCDMGAGAKRSFLTPITVEYGPFVVGAPESQQATFTIPAQWRDVEIRHENGESAVVKFRLTLFGARYELPRPASNITGAANMVLGHQSLWRGSSWVYTPPPCTFSGVGGVAERTYSFAWTTSDPIIHECTKSALHNFESMRVVNVSYAYEMNSPNPLAMRNGVYTGSLRLRVGQGGDISFGENGTPSESELILKFTLTVAHEFQVNFPSASPQVNLAPIGGWEQWTQYGKAPSSLRQELPFSLTSSSPFSVALRCEHDAGEGCGIAENVSGTVVPLDVDLTMPGMTETATNRPARNYLLRREHADTDPMFAPDGYLVGRPSNLRFAVNGAGLTEMLSRPGTQWQGDVTIVFDTEL
ncbi:hypothetical protein OHC51_03385 [Stenotrophomonas indicatrix]|uniref:hypothetical protein n=1 Tax=Stenotrophomonas indicatrix TaxID=2045451 RepID=UPI0030084697